MSLVFRLINLKRNGIHRQTILGNVGLIVAEIFGVFDFDDHSESAV